MDIKLPRIQEGDEIGTAHINAPNEALERLNINIGPQSGLGKSEGPNGTTLWVSGPTEFWAKILSGGGGTGGSSGKYAWKEQVATPSGGWADGYMQGSADSLPAYESTVNTSVPSGKIVWLRYNEAGNNFIFTYRACSY